MGMQRRPHFSLAFLIEKDERNIEITHAVDKE
jgi:hypothetical protein